MKKAERLVYTELVGEIDWDLCTFCKYDTSNSCDCGRECHHPLEHRLAMEEDDIMSDCWGFRPNLPLPIIADIIGIVLINHWHSAEWWEKDEKLLLTGR